jgi:hypothetical protein
MNLSFKNWRIVAVIVAAVLTLSFMFKLSPPNKTIPVQMVDEIEADFSFIQNWDYEIGVYKNRHGQLSCDGFCPEETDAMKVDGKIIEDSLTAFYELVDTSHLHHTMKCEATMYEWTGCNYIYVSRDTNNYIIAETGITPGTHSTLHFRIYNGKAEVWAHYNSISTLKPRNFPLKSGDIKVEKQAYESDTIKAQFDLTFSNTLESDPGFELSWNGLIYAVIQE